MRDWTGSFGKSSCVFPPNDPKLKLRGVRRRVMVQGHFSPQTKHVGGEIAAGTGEFLL